MNLLKLMFSPVLFFQTKVTFAREAFEASSSPPMATAINSGDTHGYLYLPYWFKYLLSFELNNSSFNTLNFSL
jgi:hypothetical protein